MSAASGRPPTDRELRLRALRRAFLVEADDERRELERLLAAGAAPRDEEARRARKLAHDLRGSGGSYGFPEVSAAAGALEDALGAGEVDLAPLVRALDQALAAAAARDGAA